MSNKVYYKRLDYLRIISCILVLLYHLNILKGGFLAVCTFFALSGYLGCSSALKNKEFSVKKYYLNRLKKIYFPLLIVVFCTIIIYKFFPIVNWMNLNPETNSVLFGVNNFWQLNANQDYFTRNVNSPFTHFWYISILMQFELIFPILFIFFKKIKTKLKIDLSTTVVSLLTIISTAFFFYMSKTQDIMAVYYNTFARSFSIIFGILIALFYHNYNFNNSITFKKYNTLIYMMYTFVLIALCFFVSAKSSNYAIYMILTTIISLRLIKYSIIRSHKIERVNRCVKLLAKESYGLYLVQYPIIFFMQSVPFDGVIKNVIIIVLSFVLSLGLSWLTDMRLKKILLKKIRIVCLFVIIIFGCFILVTEKDHSDEMKELEGILNENQKLSEDMNNEFLNSTNDEKAEGLDLAESKQADAEPEQAEESVATAESVEDAKNRIAEEVRQLPIVGVGDSVLLGVADKIKEVFPNGYFDGKISRTITGGKEVLQNLMKQGKLGNVLVLALANNGDYSNKKNKDLMEFLGNREIFWVNAVGADDPNFNDRFKEFASDYPNVHIVDWEAVGKNHKEYFYADGVHLKGKGITVYVDTIYNAVLEHYLKQEGIE